MNKLILTSLFFSLCFTGIRIGIELDTEVDVELVGEGDLEIGFSLGYETENDSQLNYGIEYLFPTEFDGGTADASMLSLYAKYNFFKDNNIIFSGKFGYSIPDVDDDENWNIDGGFMFGFEAKHNNLSFAYSIHNAELDDVFTDPVGYITGYNTGYASKDIDITRLCIYYSF